MKTIKIKGEIRSNKLGECTFLYRLIKNMSVIIKVGTPYDWFFSRDETFYYTIFILLSRSEHGQNIIFCPLYRMAIIYKTNGL